MRRGLVIGCLLGFFLAGMAGCGKDEKSPGPSAPRAPRLPKPKDADKTKDQGKKP